MTTKVAKSTKASKTAKASATEPEFRTIGMRLTTADYNKLVAAYKKTEFASLLPLATWLRHMVLTKLLK